jgi:CheY-like chemotaxis protein
LDMEKASAKKRILFVDDDDLLVETLPGIVEADCGYRATGLLLSDLDSVKEIIRELATGTYHVLLLDIHMPVISGLKLTPRIRRLGIKTPIILHTGYSFLPMAVEAMRIGAADLMIKPFQIEDIVLSVEGVLAQAEEPTLGISKVSQLPFPRGLNPDGITKEYYRDGRIMGEFSCRSRKLDGLSKVFRRTGTLLCEASFSGGVEDGSTVWYSYDGQMRIRDDFVKGKQLGRKIYDPEGRVS